MSALECHADTRVVDVYFGPSAFVFELADGRALSVPIAWYPALDRATESERAKWEHRNQGTTIFWPCLTLLISIDELFAGTAALDYSREFKQKSFIQTENSKENVSRDIVGTAYVVCDDANARYDPNDQSAIRMTPPYGEEIYVIENREGWSKMKWSGRSAWILQSKISKIKPKKRSEPNVSENLPQVQSRIALTSGIEVGPRGGVFTRTKSGFRKYF